MAWVSVVQVSVLANFGGLRAAFFWGEKNEREGEEGREIFSFRWSAACLIWIWDYSYVLGARRAAVKKDGR